MASSHGKQLFDLLAGHILETSRLRPVLDFLSAYAEGSLAAPAPATQLLPNTSVPHLPAPARKGGRQKTGEGLTDMMRQQLQEHGTVKVKDIKPFVLAAGFAVSSVSTSFGYL